MAGPTPHINCRLQHNSLGPNRAHLPDERSLLQAPHLPSRLQPALRWRDKPPPGLRRTPLSLFLLCYSFTLFTFLLSLYVLPVFSCFLPVVFPSFFVSFFLRSMLSLPLFACLNTSCLSFSYFWLCLSWSISSFHFLLCPSACSLAFSCRPLMLLVHITE